MEITQSTSKLQQPKIQQDEAEEFAKIIEQTNLETEKILVDTMNKMSITRNPDTYVPKRYKWLKRVC